MMSKSTTGENGHSCPFRAPGTDRNVRSPLFRAACFDLDGTLVDTELLWSRATADYLADLGCIMSADDLAALVYGHAWSFIYNRLTRLFPEQFKHRTAAATAEELNAYYFRLREDPRAIIIPSSLEFFKRVAEKMPVTIVSGSPRDAIRDCLEIMGVSHLVPFYVGSEDYALGKPDPACYLLAAKRFNLPPEHCVAFEDSRPGVNSAKAAGMYCVALQRHHDGPQQDLSAADCVVSDLNLFEVPMSNREGSTGK